MQEQASDAEEPQVSSPSTLPRAGSHEERGMTGAPAECVARLRWLLVGDPLGVRAQVVKALRQRCLLLDPEWVTHRVLLELSLQVGPGDGLIAIPTQGVPGPEGVDPERSDPERSDPERSDPERSDPERSDPEGVDHEQANKARSDQTRVVVSQVVRTCIQQQVDGALPGGEILHQLARPLKLEDGELRAACRAFNVLPKDRRRAFLQLILQRKSIEVVCGGSAAAAQCSYESARSAFLGVLEALQRVASADAATPGPTQPMHGIAPGL